MLSVYTASSIHIHMESCIERSRASTMTVILVTEFGFKLLGVQWVGPFSLMRNLRRINVLIVKTSDSRPVLKRFRETVLAHEQVRLPRCRRSVASCRPTCAHTWHTRLGKPIQARQGRHPQPPTPPSAYITKRSVYQYFRQPASGIAHLLDH